MKLPLARPPVIEVDKADFELTLWKVHRGEYHVKKKYSITIGAIGHETPTGVYRVERKARKPEWLAPNEPWVPEQLRNKIVPFEDPENPFAGGFVSVSLKQGVGIHGTKFPPMVGTKASHGCIRMTVEDINDLYPRVPLGSLVFIY